MTYNVLIEYVQAVLINFVDENGNFDAVKYFYDVFSPNVDIWGFVLTYMPFIEDGYGKLHKDVVNGICRVLIKYCFSPEFAIKPIVVNELAADLASLSNIARSIPKLNAPAKMPAKMSAKMPTKMPAKMPKQKPLVNLNTITSDITQPNKAIPKTKLLKGINEIQSLNELQI